MNVDQLLEDSVLNAKMAQLAQRIETDVADATKEFAQWVGTPGQLVNSAADFLNGVQRLDEMAVPMSDRYGVMPPADFYALGSSFTTQTFYGNKINDRVLNEMKLPMIGSVQPYMAQTSVNITTGTRTVAGAIAAPAQNVDYLAVKDGYTQDLDVDGLGSGATVNKGETFTIDGVFAVNPRTKENLGFLQEFTVLEDATADGSGAVTLKIANPIIVPSGTAQVLLTNTAFQTCTAVPADDAVITFKGAPGTTFRTNSLFHKDAVQLAFVKPERPYTGEYSYATDPDTGIVVRTWAFSDGNSDQHSVRCDILYGVVNHDRRLGLKLSGTV